MYGFYLTEESHFVEEFQFRVSKFALIWKEQCLNGSYELKKADTNEVCLHEKHPSNLQTQKITISNTIEHLRRPSLECDNLLKRRLKA